MNRLIKIFGVVLLAQAVLSAPAYDEEQIDPELRGVLDSVLSPLMQVGQELLSEVLNGIGGNGGGLISGLLNGMNPGNGLNNPYINGVNSPYVNPQLSGANIPIPYMNVEQDDLPEDIPRDGQLLDILNAIGDFVLNQPNLTTESPDDDVEEIPMYVVVV